MIPIHELLNRIRWDEHFDGRFEIGYYDRFNNTLLRVPFDELGFPPGDHFAFVFVDKEGTAHNIPYHRVRQVYRNGELIWHREP